MLNRASHREFGSWRLAGVLAGGLALTAGAATAQDPAFEWSDRLEAGATLRVFSVNGEITVNRASGRNASVRGRGRPDDRGRFDIRFEAREVADGVVICAVYEDGTCDENGVSSNGRSRSRHGRANFVVELPEGVVLRVGSGNGDVTVAGATADVHASSGNGDVRVGAGAGRVRASSGNGEVVVEGARAAVQASSGNGGIRVSTEAGPVNASTGNGSIQVRMASLREQGDMEFTSGNGSITLHLPDDLSADLTATTGHGSFDLDFPVRMEGRLTTTRVRGTIGDGARRLRIATGNGSINLRRLGGM